jgi:cytochrome c-type biogenesis protein CcmH/NrfG
MGLIGLIVAAMIVCLLAFAGFRAYVAPQKPQAGNRIAEPAAPAQAQGFDASNPSLSLDSIKKQLDGAAQKEMERAQDMDEGRI